MSKKMVMVVAIALCFIGVKYVAYAEMNTKSYSASWRYKITVSVETPEGVKTGYAVREVTDQIKPFPLDKRRPWRSNVTVKGEAVVVDLGERGKLFVLLDGDDAWQVVFRTFPFAKGGLTPEGASYYAQLKAGPQSVKKIPSMVTFKDINDPKSVVAVNQSNLSENFGENIKLKDVAIEMTDEKVTSVMARYLVWLSHYYNQRLDGQRFGSINSKNKLANSLSSGSFSTGEIVHE